MKAPAALVAALVFAAVLTTMNHLPKAESAITCGRVMQVALPCLGYLRNGGVLTPVCCGAAKGLYEATRGAGDRRTACACLKSAAPGLGLKFHNADVIASKCGVNLGFRIDPSINCSKVNWN